MSRSGPHSCYITGGTLISLMFHAIWTNVDLRVSDWYCNQTILISQTEHPKSIKKHQKATLKLSVCTWGSDFFFPTRTAIFRGFQTARYHGTSLPYEPLSSGCGHTKRGSSKLLDRRVEGKSCFKMHMFVYGCFPKWWVFPPNHPFQ